MSRTIGIFGASGFGREVLPLVRAQLRRDEPDANVVFVESEAARGTTVNDTDVIAEASFLESATPRGFVVAIANGAVRRRLFSLAEASGARPFEVRSASAEVLDMVTLGPGAILCGHSSLTSNTAVGRGLHLNISAYLAHDCLVGDFVTFGPGAFCAGNVIIEDEVYIGAGAMIRQGKPGTPIVIGKGAVIGMGAVVTSSVPPGVTMVGSPARAIEERANK